MVKLFQKKYFFVPIILICGILIGWWLKPASNGSDHSSHSVAGSADNQVWTCSMHPQIRQSAPGKCPICGMELVQLDNNQSNESSPYIHKMSAEAVALSNIQTETVKYTNPESKLRLTGKIVINEKNLSVISANYGGRIDRLFINETGQNIRAGETIAIIYSPDLITAQKELLETGKFKATNPVLYNAARQKLKGWKISDNQINAMENNGEVQTHFPVKTNQSGVVLSLQVTQGDFVSAGQALFEIADLSSVWVTLDAYESDLSLIEKGSKVSFTVPSVPGKVYTSSIDFIDPLINPNNRTAGIRAIVSNKDLLLKPEMFVNATIERNHNPDKMLVVPKSAVLWTGKRSVAYVKLIENDMPAFEMRELTIGERFGDYYKIVNGIQEGEEIVVNGAFAIDAASQLNGGYSMMNRPENLYDKLPEEFILELNAITNQYLILKNSAMISDISKVSQDANKLKLTISSIQDSEISGDVLNKWLSEKTKITKSLKSMIGSKSIDAQRKELAQLSESLISLLKEFRYNDVSLYIDQCPMAIEDKGAFWLSEFKEIKNPYFGESMLSCGEVKEVIRPVENSEIKK